MTTASISPAMTPPTATGPPAWARSGVDPTSSRNQGLVRLIARRFLGSRLPLEEIVSMGQIGLLRACERFDPARGCAFSTFAAYWVEQSIRHELFRWAWPVLVPDYLRRRAAAGVFADQARRMLRARVRSGFPESIEAPPRNADADAAAIEDVLSVLTPAQRDVIRLRFGLGGGPRLSLADAARALGLGRESVQLVQVAAMKALRASAGVAGPPPVPPRPRPTSPRRRAVLDRVAAVLAAAPPGETPSYRRVGLAAGMSRTAAGRALRHLAHEAGEGVAS